jgi:UDP-glucose 4-epimerase
MNGGVLVTGAAGFIGKSLIAELARVNRNSESRRARYARGRRSTNGLPNVTYLTGDVRDPALRDMFEVRRPQTVVHLASVVAVGGDPQRDWEIDVLGTKNVLQGRPRCRRRAPDRDVERLGLWLSRRQSGAAA